MSTPGTIALTYAPRQTPDGPPRLIAVKIWFEGASRGMLFDVHLRSPAGWTTDAERVRHDVAEYADDPAAGSRFVFDVMPKNADGRTPMAWRIFAGQPDPSNPARFTIDYETPAGGGALEGWLTADDRVMMRVLKPTSR